MISTLLVTAAILAIALWLTIMYAWWRQESGAPVRTPATAIAVSYAAVCTRLARRGWYACMLYVGTVRRWTNRKVQKVFFSLFPAAKPAFAKHDALAGLKHGPTSYFLRSISEKETAASKKTVRSFS